MDDQKITTLKNIVGLHEKLETTKAEVARLDKRVATLEHVNSEEHRHIKNQVKRTAKTVIQLAVGHRKDIEASNHRITDTAEKLDGMQKIVDWVFYTIAGLVITSILGAILKYVLKL